MGAKRSRFAGGDVGYLKDEQYRDPSRLAIRTELHLKYGTAVTPWFDWVQQQARIPAGSLVLDVGCGEGRLWAAAAAPREVVVIATDLSVGMAGSAATRIATGSPRAVHAATADVQHLPYPAASFDVVVANHMLYHPSDPAEAVAELARVLRPDGLLVAATNGERHLAEFGEIRAPIFGTQTRDDTLDAFGIETGRPLLEAHFEDVAWVDYPDRLDCTDPADVIAYLRSVPPGEAATDEQVEVMTAEVHRRFEAGGGTMSITKESGVFLCRTPSRR